MSVRVGLSSRSRRGRGILRCVISSVARNLSERFLGPTNPVGPRNDKGGLVIPTNPAKVSSTPVTGGKDVRGCPILAL